VAAKFVLEKDAAGRFRFRLMSQGRVLASSESYTTKRAAQNAIESIRTTAPAAQVDDGTQPAAGKVRVAKSTNVAKKVESVVEVPKRKARSARAAVSKAASKASKTTKA
jgi:uncharacterized protein YegP (UPF0339 family)